MVLPGRLPSGSTQYQGSSSLDCPCADVASGDCASSGSALSPPRVLEMASASCKSLQSNTIRLRVGSLAGTLTGSVLAAESSPPFVALATLPGGTATTPRPPGAAASAPRTPLMRPEGVNHPLSRLVVLILNIGQFRLQKSLGISFLCHDIIGDFS